MWKGNCKVGTVKVKLKQPIQKWKRVKVEWNVKEWEKVSLQVHEGGRPGRLAFESGINYHSFHCNDAICSALPENCIIICISGIVNLHQAYNILLFVVIEKHLQTKVFWKGSTIIDSGNMVVFFRQRRIL